MVHATRYLVPSVRSKVFADRPFFAVVTCQAASNQVVNEVRVLSRIVPAVADPWWRQAVHTSRPRLWRHGVAVVWHAGQTNPVGHRKPHPGSPGDEDDFPLQVHR